VDTGPDWVRATAFGDLYRRSRHRNADLAAIRNCFEYAIAHPLPNPHAYAEPYADRHRHTDVDADLDGDQ